MKKVFLYAYDKVNLGDDLFITSIIERYSSVKFYMWSNGTNKALFSDHKNLCVIDNESTVMNFIKNIRSSLIYRIKAHYEKKCDAVVYIGGSIFMEYESWPAFVNWLDYETKKHSFYVLGANFGPYRTENFKNRLSLVFNNMRDVCFRDKYSKDLFPNLHTVRYAPDILFSSMQQYQIQPKKKQVFVSLINCEHKAKDDLNLLDKSEICMEEVQRVCQRFLNDGYSLVLSSFCKEEGDEESVYEMYNLLNSNNVTIINYDGTNANAIKRAIAESEYVIGERFHAVVLGLAAGCSVVPVVYSNKTINILKDLDFCGQVVDIRNIHKGELKYKTIIDNHDLQILRNISEISMESQEHFRVLDKALRG